MYVNFNDILVIDTYNTVTNRRKECFEFILRILCIWFFQHHDKFGTITKFDICRIDITVRNNNFDSRFKV